LVMRLYLSSFDVGTQPDELVKLVGRAGRIAIIVNALDHRPEARDHWLADQTGKLAALGFDVAELDLRNYFGQPGALDAVLSAFGVVWINGGNAFILRRAMKQSGFDGIVRRYLEKDAIVYAGFSAAAVVCFDSLRGLEITDDPNEVPLGYDPDIVWAGLGLVPFAMVVHFKSDHPESTSADRELAFYEANGIPYRSLRDGEVFVLDKGVERIVGAQN
jgi:dipeptidase E